jgi:hypothetical protein
MWNSECDGILNSEGDEIWNSEGGEIWNSEWDEIWNSKEDEIWNSECDEIWNSEGDEIWNSEGDEIWNSEGDEYGKYIFFFHIRTVHLDIIKVLLTHQLMHKWIVLKTILKFKMYIKTAPTCFGAVNQLRIP